MMLRIRTFIFLLCIILHLTNAYYYNGNYRQRHLHVYNCGLHRCIRQRAPPVCQQWCITYIFVGYCKQARYYCCSFREKPGFCPNTNLSPCKWPYPFYQTHFYSCQHDFNCPSHYKCCHDGCYAHKVCKAPCRNNEEVTTWSFTRDTEETTLRTLPTQKQNESPDFEIEITELTRDTEETTLRAFSTFPTQDSPDTEIEITEVTRDTEETTVAEDRRTTDPLESTTEITGSGDFEIREPEAARLFANFGDDEDFVAEVIYR